MSWIWSTIPSAMACWRFFSGTNPKIISHNKYSTLNYVIQLGSFSLIEKKAYHVPWQDILRLPYFVQVQFHQPPVSVIDQMDIYHLSKKEEKQCDQYCQTYWHVFIFRFYYINFFIIIFFYTKSNNSNSNGNSNSNSTPRVEPIFIAHALNRLCGIRVLFPLSMRFSCLATI